MFSRACERPSIRNCAELQYSFLDRSRRIRPNDDSSILKVITDRGAIRKRESGSLKVVAVRGLRARSLQVGMGEQKTDPTNATIHQSAMRAGAIIQNGGIWDRWVTTIMGANSFLKQAIIRAESILSKPQRGC